MRRSGWTALFVLVLAASGCGTDTAELEEKALDWIERSEAKLAEASVKIDSLQARVERVASGSREELADELDSLRTRERQARERLAELQRKTEERMDDVRERAEEEVAKIQAAIEHLEEKLSD